MGRHLHFLFEGLSICRFPCSTFLPRCFSFTCIFFRPFFFVFVNALKLFPLLWNKDYVTLHHITEIFMVHSLHMWRYWYVLYLSITKKKIYRFRLLNYCYNGVHHVCLISVALISLPFDELYVKMVKINEAILNSGWFYSCMCLF